MTMKVCWRDAHLGGVLIVTGIFKAPFIGTLEPSIPIRRVFIKVSFEGGIPICAITLLEMIVTTLSSSVNT
jgi:hypothetical protein